jgi:hypothetical protein
LRRLPAPLAALVLALLVPLSATAQTAPAGVTLGASAARVDAGESVTLSGAVVSGAAGEIVTVLDDLDAVIVTATTASGGAFSVEITPEATTTYRAAWGTAVSDPVTVEVRAEVSVTMGNARLFDRVRVRGSVEPVRPGDPVDVWLTIGGRTVSERTVETGAAGGFQTAFRVMQPGTYRAHAAVVADDLLRGAAVSEPDATPLPPLREGSSGVFVGLLEQRLLDLHYRLIAAKDGRYDFRTADAVVAFHKVQGMPRTFTVDAATWRALADPRTPRPRLGGKAFHFEVDQSRQVLYTVEGGEITNILHVSTGKPSTPTRDGTFSVVRKIAGFSPHQLYYPSFFDGNRALHGWPDVPTYAASHGCVRIPYWNAIWVYGLAAYGTRVAVYH